MVLGGGIAGIEALLALHDLAGELTEITLVAPTPDFLYKPTTIEEPFTTQPAERRELAPLAAELGAVFRLGAVRRVDPLGGRIELGGGEEIPYDRLVVCIGGKAEDPYGEAITFRATGEPLEVDALLDRALEHPSHRLAFVVPPGVSWSLPLYELALMTRRRADESDRGAVELALYTPESVPLAIFGRTASDAVAELLRVRRIEFVGDSHVVEDPQGGFGVAPGHLPLEAGAVVALPLIEGPRLEGLPADDSGFIPIDDYARVADLPGVYAAGDGTNFPVKQGGIGTQQADAAAEHIAALARCRGRAGTFPARAPRAADHRRGVAEHPPRAGGRTRRGPGIPGLPLVAAAQGQRPLPGSVAGERDPASRSRAAGPSARR